MFVTLVSSIQSKRTTLKGNIAALTLLPHYFYYEISRLFLLYSNPFYFLSCCCCCCCCCCWLSWCNLKRLKVVVFPIMLKKRFYIIFILLCIYLLVYLFNVRSQMTVFKVLPLIYTFFKDIIHYGQLWSVFFCIYGNCVFVHFFISKDNDIYIKMVC